jgi:hypothetical protein
LLQKFINQSGFTVVNVSDDGDVTQVLNGHNSSLKPSVARKGAHYTARLMITCAIQHFYFAKK